MQRIDGPGAVLIKPENSPAANKPGYFSGGNPIEGRKATMVTKDWLNNIQEELLLVIEAVGIEPDRNKCDQLLQAIKILSANEELLVATAERLGGVKIGDGLKILADGVLSLKQATSETLGGVKLGLGLEIIANGLLNLKKADSANLGGIKIGSGFTRINDGTLSVDTSGFATDLSNAINQHNIAPKIHKNVLDFTILYPGGTEEEPGKISINQRIVIDNPFTSASCIVEVEIYYNGYWGWNGHYTAVFGSSSAQYYFVVAKTLNETIVIQSAIHGLCVEGNRGGSPIPGLIQIMTPTPFRVKVWKIGELS